MRKFIVFTFVFSLAFPQFEGVALAQDGAGAFIGMMGVMMRAAAAGQRGGPRYRRVARTRTRAARPAPAAASASRDPFASSPTGVSSKLK